MRSSGKQVVQRALVLPSKLPQVSRPSTRPTAGSKSQLAKAQRKLFADAWSREDRERQAAREVIAPPDLDALSDAPSEEDPWAHELNFIDDRHSASLGGQAPSALLGEEVERSPDEADRGRLGQHGAPIMGGRFHLPHYAQSIAWGN
eukprot:3930488-Pyramimonas_sp.AAC.1